MTIVAHKVSYSRWHYARHLLYEVHRTLGSWTEVSRAVLGHGDSPGWAKEAMSFRPIVAEHHIKSLEELIAPTKRKGRGGPRGSKLSPEQQVLFKDKVNQLATKYQWTLAEIADALGVSVTAVSAYKRSGAGTVERMRLLDSILHDLENPPTLVETLADSNSVDELLKSVERQTDELITTLQALETKLPKSLQHSARTLIATLSGEVL